MEFNSSEYVNDITLVFLSIFTPGQPPAVRYDYASYIANKIHDQFLNLENEGVFKYTTFIYHLMLYYQSDNFSFLINKLDTKGNPKFVIFWSPIFHNTIESPYTYSEFIDLFVHPATTLLKGVSPPRINGDMKKILHLSKQYSIGDCYLYKNHTEIRIYGCELFPFKLPNYVPMRLFALEYFRQIIKADLIHFCGAKKKTQLRINNQLGPFVCNTRDAWKEAEKNLEDHLRLRKSFRWVPYDPNSFICDRRMKNRLSPYIHNRIPEIEQFANLDEWIEGTLVEDVSEKVNIENAMRDLEKTLDLDYFGQVPFKLPQKSTISASTVRTSQ